MQTPRRPAVARLLALLFALGLFGGIETWSAPSFAFERPLAFQSRTPAVLLMVGPKGTTSGVASSTLFDAAGLVLEQNTDLRVQSMEQAGLDAEAIRTCPSEEQLGCWVNEVERSMRSGEHAEARVLIVVSLYPVELGEHIIHTSVIDLATALRAYRQLRDLGDQDWRERAEDAIHAEGVHVPPVRLASLDGETLVAYFRARLDGELHGFLETRGHLARLGHLEIEGTPAGLGIAIDGRAAGSSRAPSTRVTDVPIGAHRLILSTSDGRTREASIEIAAGDWTRIVYEPPPPPRSAFRTATTWISGGLAALGAGLVVVAAVQSSADLRSACVISPGADPAPCVHPGFPTLGFSPGSAPTASFEDLNPGAPSTLGLGASLFVLGGTTLASTLLFGEDFESPWVQIGLGVVAGLTSFLVINLADPRVHTP